MKKIEHVTYDWNSNGLVFDVVKEINKMIDAINNQQKQIEILTKTCDDLNRRMKVQKSKVTERREEVKYEL